MVVAFGNFDLAAIFNPPSQTMTTKFWLAYGPFQLPPKHKFQDKKNVNEIDTMKTKIDDSIFCMIFFASLPNLSCSIEVLIKIK